MDHAICIYEIIELNVAKMMLGFKQTEFILKKNTVLKENLNSKNEKEKSKTQRIKIRNLMSQKVPNVLVAFCAY